MYTAVNQKNLKELYNHLKNSAKRRNIPFELTMSDMYELSFPISCSITGEPLYFNRGKATDSSISIDRINSDKGYTADNIVVVSNRVNRIKNNGTIEELEKIAEFYNSSITSY